LLELMAASTAAAQLPGPVVDPRAHGARGDGKTNDTPAIQKEIDTCAAAGD
jgi:polygalacturonase